jgi:uncharacterized protein (DUF488 family)
VVIHTIGHSTRTLDELIKLLEAHDVGQLADIRSVPKSRRHPHFSRDALTESLPAVGIRYRHFAGLGGLRKPRPDSRNSGWRHEGFRGYADYMETAEFVASLEALVGWAALAERRRPSRHTAIMCAEAVWWRCHRQLTADALVARGIEVRHIVSAGDATVHRLTDFARVVDGRVSYPGLLGI